MSEFKSLLSIKKSGSYMFEIQDADGLTSKQEMNLLAEKASDLQLVL